ncbi:voltage-gated potassium channel [Aureococcus anophagefferens]|nr:voltage-gated potassium channel [Aureococcus anophagefferens]
MRSELQTLHKSSLLSLIEEYPDTRDELNITADARTADTVQVMAKSPGPKPGVSRQTSGRKQSICSPGLARRPPTGATRRRRDAAPGGDAVTTHLKDMVKRELAASRTEIAALVRAVVARELDAQGRTRDPSSLMGCLVRWLAVAGAHVLAVAAPEALPRPDVALCTPGGAAPGCAFAVATMASAPSLPELELFVRTLARFDGSRPLYVAVDAAAGAWLRAQTFMAAVALGLEKTTVMEAALDAGHAGVLLRAAGVIWLSPLPAMGPEALGVSRCLCSKHTERRYGRYNGGMVFARNASVLDVWRRGASLFEPLAAHFRPHFDMTVSAAGWDGDGDGAPLTVLSPPAVAVVGAGEGISDEIARWHETGRLRRPRAFSLGDAVLVDGRAPHRTAPFSAADLEEADGVRVLVCLNFASTDPRR